MKICVLGLEIIPQRNLAFYGGLANNVVRISRGLRQHRKHSIYIITSDVNRTLKGSIRTSWAEIYPIKMCSRFTSTLFGIEFFTKALIEIFKKNSESKFDILHVHSAYPIMGCISIFSSLTTRIPTVFTLYSPLSISSMGRQGFSRLLLLRSLSKVFLSQADHIIAISQNVKQSLKNVGFREDRITVVPPIVDTDLFNPNLSGRRKRRELSLEDNVPMILYCGNWTPWKGVDLLVESMARVVRKIPNAKLVLAFGEPIGWYLQKRAFVKKKIKNLKLDSHFIELGFVHDIEHLLAACNVFVAPFLDTRAVADIPLSILEAMACGKPVIATNVGGIPEIIRQGENGLLVEPNNEHKLAEAICFILTHSQTAKDLGENALMHVLQNYSIETITEKIERVYERTIEAFHKG